MASYPIVVDVPEPARSSTPSLLGRDVTNLFRLIIEAKNNVLVLDRPEKYR